MRLSLLPLLAPGVLATHAVSAQRELKPTDESLTQPLQFHQRLLGAEALRVVLVCILRANLVSTATAAQNCEMKRVRGARKIAL